MKARKKLNAKRARRTARTKATMWGTKERPRLAVRRSNRYFYAQLIDDVKGNTLVAVSSLGVGTPLKAGTTTEKKTKSMDAFTVGELLGKKAKEKGITVAVFDRRSYKFHGRVKSFADGAKKGGLKI